MKVSLLFKNKHSLPCKSLLRSLIKKAHKDCKAPNIYYTVFTQPTGQQIFVVQCLHKAFVVLCLHKDTLFWDCHSKRSWIYQWQPGALQQQLQNTNRFKYTVLKLLYKVCMTVPKYTWVKTGPLLQQQPIELQLLGTGKYIVVGIIFLKNQHLILF
jgi:hypothetical protein